MEQQTVYTANGDAMLSPIVFDTPTNRQPETGYLMLGQYGASFVDCTASNTPEQLAELANRILQADVPGMSG